MIPANILLVVISLCVLVVLLINKRMLLGVLWVVFSLPLYELGRIHIGPIPTTVVEINILFLFGWWIGAWNTGHGTRGMEHRIDLDTESRYVSRISYLVSHLRTTFGSWLWIILTWLVIATFSTLISPNLREALGVWKAFFVEPILFLIVFVSVIKKENVIQALSALILSGVFVAIIGIIQRFTGWWIENPFWATEATRRVTSVFPFPNAVGLFLAPIAMIALTMAVSALSRITKNKEIKKYGTVIASEPRTVRGSVAISNVDHRQNERLSTRGGSASGMTSQILTMTNNTLRFTLYALPFCLMLLAILFARSRGAVLGIVGGIVILAIIHVGKRIWYWLGIGIIIAAILMSGQSDAIKKQFFSQPTSFSGGDSIQIRLEQWKETIQFITSNPLLGARVAGYQTAIAEYHTNTAVEIYKYPHNIFLNFWMELGFLGVALFVFIIIAFYRSWFRQRRNELREERQNRGLSIHDLGVAVTSSMTTLLIHGLVDVPYFKNDLSILFWILIGISIIIRQNQEVRILSQE